MTGVACESTNIKRRVPKVCEICAVLMLRNSKKFEPFILTGNYVKTFSTHN